MQREIDLLLICTDRKEAFTINAVMSRIGGFSSLTLIESLDEARDHLEKIALKTKRFPELIFLNVEGNIDGYLALTEFIKSHDLVRSIPIVVMLPKKYADSSDEFYRRHANCCIVRNEDPASFEKDVANIWSFWADTAKLNCRELL